MKATLLGIKYIVGSSSRSEESVYIMVPAPYTMGGTVHLQGSKLLTQGKYFNSDLSRTLCSSMSTRDDWRFQVLLESEGELMIWQAGKITKLEFKNKEGVAVPLAQSLTDLIKLEREKCTQMLSLYAAYAKDKGLW